MWIAALKNCLSNLKFSLFRAKPLFCAFRQKVEPSLRNLNPRLNKVEHKFANIQILFDFLSILKLRKHSKWRAKKNEHGEGIMPIRTFVLKVINNERKWLTHHEIIDHTAEQTASVIVQVSKESKLRIHSNLWRPRFSFTYSFKFTYKDWISIIVMNVNNWVKNHCRLLKAIHF